jgi:hypothetical protein
VYVFLYGNTLIFDYCFYSVGLKWQKIRASLVSGVGNFKYNSFRGWSQDFPDTKNNEEGGDIR